MPNNKNRPKKNGLDAFWLKIIAIFGMTANHAAHIFGNDLLGSIYLPLYGLGGLTFPIMAYFLTEGYRRTRNIKRYMLRLLIFALLAQVPFMLAFNVYMLNVLFTLLLGLLSLYLYDKITNKPLFFLIFMLIIYLTVFCDWNFIGVPLLFGFGTVKGEKRRIILPLLTMTAFMFPPFFVSSLQDGRISPDLLYFISSLLVIPLLLKYNGNRGRNMKYFFYAFYPLHLLILWLIKFLI